MARTTKSESTSPRNAEQEGFTAQERAAMKERAQEVKATRGKGGKGKDLEPEVLAKIAEMSDGDRALAERVHAIIRATAPELAPRTWYGMPAYAKDGKVVCFFQAADKFSSRYATLGFSDEARHDDGAMWPTSYALAAVDDAVEARIAELVRTAIA
ncbi:hypothetical protein N866_19100 [Actinotalea ferrariae CF5-4]|uniref:Uncharacterized protein n=1 Tax=Actinotalea ferrariae CF5-4 TaxID=948458 RepID=A0A021VR94_9CELL|nr:DUF1801 domain-containing protein [Actinotalea ferrariae]EYR63643.1 hypothetical protein N866_19100 [Actinotalea ferrariae CF5-4]